MKHFLLRKAYPLYWKLRNLRFLLTPEQELPDERPSRIFFINSLVDLRSIMSVYERHSDEALIVDPKGIRSSELLKFIKRKEDYLLLPRLMDKEVFRFARQGSVEIYEGVKNHARHPAAALIRNLLLSDPFITKALFFQCLMVILSVKKIYEKYSPEMTITTKDDFWIYRIVHLVARNNCSRVMMFQHGVFPEDYLCGPLLADEVSLWDNQSKHCLEKYWGSIIKVHFSVVGKSYQRFYQSEALGLEGFILYATQPLKFKLKWLHARSIIKTFLAFPRETFIVKVHPKERTWFYKFLLLAHQVGNAKIVREYDVELLLNDCKLLITVYSAVAKEAQIFGKPVVIVRLSQHIPHLEFMDKSVNARTVQDIPLAIESVLLNSGAKSTCHRYSPSNAVASGS